MGAERGAKEEADGVAEYLVREVREWWDMLWQRSDLWQGLWFVAQ